MIVAFTVVTVRTLDLVTFELLCQHHSAGQSHNTETAERFFKNVTK